jgi:Undecaprenyl-phosphate glucose phosphotransferase
MPDADDPGIAVNAPQRYTLASQSGTQAAQSGWIALCRAALAAGVFAADIAGIVAASCAAGIAYHLAAYGARGSITAFLEVGLIAASIFSIANLVRGEYAAASLPTFRPRLVQTLHLWNLAFVSLLVIGFVAKANGVYSRGAALLFYATALPVLVALRLTMAQIVGALGRAGLLGARRIFLFGTGSGIFEFVSTYARRPGGTAVVGCRFVTPSDDPVASDHWRASLQLDLEAAIAAARTLQPEAIVLLLPWSASEAIEICVERFLALPAEVHLGPDRVLQKYSDVQLSRFGAFASFRLTRVPLSRFELALKRALDLSVASVALFMLTPLLLATAALIKLDSRGPVFFLQRRSGFNQRPFRIIKFRTMHTLDDGDHVQQALPGDARVTRTGRWLRRWNIDEIPQLLNVLMGDMSLVGPRPHAVSHDREYGRRIAIYARRHNVKPGITGWAQVNGFRGETRSPGNMESRVAYDLHYIENWSLALDLRILVRTMLSATAFRNAY